MTTATSDWATPNLTAQPLLDALTQEGITTAHMDQDAVRWITVPAPQLAHLTPNGSRNVELWTFSFDTAGADPTAAPLVLADETFGWTLSWVDQNGYQQADDYCMVALTDLTSAGADIPDPDAFTALYVQTVTRLLNAQSRDALDTIGAEASEAFRSTYQPRPE